MARAGKSAKAVGFLLVAWWLLLLIGAGLVGNGYLALLAFRAGSTIGTLVFIVCFCGSGVYLYRTVKHWDWARAIFKD